MRFLLLLLLLLHFAASAREKSLNVVLFFANYNDTQVDEIACVKIPKVAVIRPFSKNRLRQISNNRRIMHGTYAKRRHCQHNLVESIYSLLNWARNTMHMATAIIALQTNENRDGVTYHVDIHNKQQEEPNVINIEPKKKPPSTQTENSTKTDLVIDNPEYAEDDALVMMNPYSRQIKFNTLKNEYPQHYINLKRFERSIGVPPINHQVIHIKSKTSGVTSTSAPKPKWNVAKSIENLKNSFLTNFISPIVDLNQNFVDDDEFFDTSALGEVQKRSLFAITDEVLNNIKSVENKRGFLVAVFGGDLSMLEKPYSELVQAIKHVLETCENTLIVVTSNCPPNVGYAKIPIYATGPSARSFNKAEELLDIPKILFDVLKKNDTNLNDSEQKDVEAIARMSIGL